MIKLPNLLPLSVIILLVSLFSSVIFVSTPTNAIKASDFNPGRIIDDVIFYNTKSMTASEIQAFLNSKVPSCDTNGTQPATDKGYPNLTHAEYAAMQNNPSVWHQPPYTCLKNFKQNTPQVEAASGLCSAISAKSNRTAAQIISDVSSACNINPQVLIILLEKEQSLITDYWPLNHQYNRATGFACPDNVGGVCDPDFNGFFRQVYAAARQFNVYKTNPLNYNYIAGRTNNIYWQTDGGGFINVTGSATNRKNGQCGYSQVYIENQATAALYIYTPYRPNQAALNNYPGTGDACSAYGNRNFWFLFNNWFGSTSYFIQGSIGDRYKAIGGRDTFGLPVNNEVSLSTGGKYQQFEKGRIYWKSGIGAWEVAGSIKDRYVTLNADRSSLGYPVGTEISISSGAKYQQFEGGRIYWKSGIGAKNINGAIGTQYLGINAEDSRIGLPISNEIVLTTGGKYQQFEKGRIYWKSGIGAWEVAGSIGSSYYANLQADRSAFGYPTGSEITTNDSVKYQQFEGGRIYWSKNIGTRNTYGQIGAQYINLGAHESRLGLPISGERIVSNGGKYQQLQKGRIYWSKNTGAWSIGGSIGSRYYNELAADASPLGYPTDEEKDLSSGTKFQNFEGGRIYWKSSLGAYSVYGKINEHYATIGADKSRLGLPTSNEIRLASGGVYQQFEKGRIYWKSSLGAYDTAGSIGARYYSLGGDVSKLGYPKSIESTNVNGAITQNFEHGYITYYNRTTTYKITSN